MSMSSGRMPSEFIFPMEFLSLFQDNIAPFALQSVLYVESMKQEFFPPAPETRNFAASVPQGMSSFFLNSISGDTKMLLSILAFNKVDLSSNPSCRSVFSTILIFCLFKKPDILNSHCTFLSLAELNMWITELTCMAVKKTKTVEEFLQKMAVCLVQAQSLEKFGLLSDLQHQAALKEKIKKNLRKMTTRVSPSCGRQEDRIQILIMTLKCRCLYVDLYVPISQ